MEEDIQTSKNTSPALGSDTAPDDTNNDILEKSSSDAEGDVSTQNANPGTTHAAEQGPADLGLDPDAIDVDLNHHRLVKIEGLECLHQVESLCLRWNLIPKIENLHMLTTLKVLELYDNQISVIENLDALVNLE